MDNINRLDEIVARVRAEFKVYRTEAKRYNPNTDSVLDWYKDRQTLLPMMSSFAAILYSIPPSQIENERDFSLAGVYGCARRSSMSIQMLSSLLFLNKNTSLFSTNPFEESTEVLEEYMEDVETALLQEQNGDEDDEVKE